MSIFLLYYKFYVDLSSLLRLVFKMKAVTRIVFRSIDSIKFVNKKGVLDNKITYEGAFFFGTISVIDYHYVSLFTKHNSDSNDSHVYLVGIDRQGIILIKTDLGSSYIISADTSGFYEDNSHIYVSGDKSLFKIYKSTGNIMWELPLNEILGRYTPIIDKLNVYLTSLIGTIYCVDKEKGMTNINNGVNAKLESAIIAS